MNLSWVLPTVRDRPERRPARCPRCGSRSLARHGTCPKPLTDTKVSHDLGEVVA